jgi:hypothetical protein
MLTCSRTSIINSTTTKTLPTSTEVVTAVVTSTILKTAYQMTTTTTVNISAVASCGIFGSETPKASPRAIMESLPWACFDDHLLAKTDGRVEPPNLLDTVYVYCVTFIHLEPQLYTTITSGMVTSTRTGSTRTVYTTSKIVSTSVVSPTVSTTITSTSTVHATTTSPIFTYTKALSTLTGPYITPMPWPYVQCNGYFMANMQSNVPISGIGGQLFQANWTSDPLFDCCMGGISNNYVAGWQFDRARSSGDRCYYLPANENGVHRDFAVLLGPHGVIVGNGLSGGATSGQYSAAVEKDEL